MKILKAHRPLGLAAVISICAFLIGPTSSAKTPDGQTPANEGVCDELKFGTPGLYGLCVAFCEAQDCEIDWSGDDPFEKCRPGGEEILRNYRKKMRNSDPDMPCIKSPCPCWSEDEIVQIRGLSESDTLVFCRRNFDSSVLKNFDYFVISGAGYETIVRTFVHDSFGPSCGFKDVCDESVACLNIDVSLRITAEELETCQHQLNEAGADRGLDCFLN